MRCSIYAATHARTHAHPLSLLPISPCIYSVCLPLPPFRLPSSPPPPPFSLCLSHSPLLFLPLIFIHSLSLSLFSLSTKVFSTPPPIYLSFLLQFIIAYLKKENVILLGFVDELLNKPTVDCHWFLNQDVLSCLNHNHGKAVVGWGDGTNVDHIWGDEQTVKKHLRLRGRMGIVCIYVYVYWLSRHEPLFQATNESIRQTIVQWVS